MRRVTPTTRAGEVGVGAWDSEVADSGLADSDRPKRWRVAGFGAWA